MPVDLAQVIPPLVRAKVDFILFGGMAAILPGSARVTFDVDVVYSRTHDNIERLHYRISSASPLPSQRAVGSAFCMGCKNNSQRIEFYSHDRPW
jgi:hypothetical protein